MKPSNYKTHPYGSIEQKTETEVIALNIMKILARNGDKWRTLSWREYERERKKDGNFSESLEEYYFLKAVKHCKSASAANRFCSHWGKP